MARSYVIQKGDTLRKIAKNFYGDPEQDSSTGQGP